MEISSVHRMGSLTKEGATARYRGEIDSLRAIAILLVLISHWEPTWFKTIDWGIVGVYIFFTISGYLITGILVDQQSCGGVNIKRFYLNRSLRIWPIYFASLAFLYVFWRGFDRGTLLWHALFASNILFGITNKFGFPVHFWSLSVEQQFYLIWPFVVILLRRNLRFVCYAMLVIAPLFRWYFYVHLNNIQLSAFSLVSNTDFLAAGALLAIAEREGYERLGQILSMIGIVSATALGMMLASSGLLRDTLIWVTGSSIAGLSVWSIFWIGKNNLANLIMCNPITRYIGKISYGIYIYHLMIGYLIWGKYGSALTPIEYMALCFIATVLVAAASWHFIERPILSIKRPVERITLKMGEES